MSNDAIEAFRDSARDYLSRSQTISRLRALRDSETGFDRAAWQEIANSGWPALLVSEEDGGMGLGLREMAAIAEEIGQHLLPEPYLAVAVQASTALSRSPRGALRSLLLEQLATGELIAGLAWQEQLGQLEPGNIATTATAAGDGWVLNGTKRFVLPGAGADGWLVLAKHNAKPLLCWVPAGSEGLSVSSQRCVDGSMVADLALNQVRVPATHVLAEDYSALLAVTDANDVTRVMQAAELLGVMRRALATTIEYLNTRKQFGRAIGSFQALKHRTVDAYVHDRALE